VGLELYKFITDGGDARTFPKISCDYCGEWIENARVAHVLWDGEEEAQKPSFVHLHCSRAFDHCRGQRSFCQPLGAFLYNLLNNIHYDPIRGEHLAAVGDLREIDREREARVQGREPLGPHLRRAVFERDSYTCQHCGVSSSAGSKLRVEHIVPVVCGGSSELDNLQTLCASCNARKGER
jgi:5-methylcytosine-specific restriction endonuclease McrA